MNNFRNGDKVYTLADIEKMEKRIAELNDIVSVLTIADETGYVDGEGFVVGFNQITDDAREFLLAHNLEQKAQACFELASEGGEDKKLTYIPLREINNFGVNYSKQAKQLKEHKDDE